jgi:Putative transposase
MFRGKLLAFLKQSYRRNELCFTRKLAELSTPRAFHTLLGDMPRREWVVYSKPPFGGPEHVLKYLARYTHRVAISNGRLLSLENGQVSFRWRDSRHNNRSSVMKLDAVEFVRRFLLHVLPSGFVKVRHFGLLANRNRRQALALCRLRLCTTAADPGSLLTEQQKSRSADLAHSANAALCTSSRVVPPLSSPVLVPRFITEPSIPLEQEDANTMPTPTRLRTTTDSQTALDAYCRESAPNSSPQPSNCPVRLATPARIQSARANGTSFRARLAASTHRRQHSIPIHPPR